MNWKIHAAGRRDFAGLPAAAPRNDDVLHAANLPPVIQAIAEAPPCRCALSIRKRIVDIVLSLALVLMLAPLFMLVALAIRIDSPGPALFRQTRLGLRGKPFKILKFRTMNVMEDGAAVRQATPDDVRTTNLGRILRKTSIDETPQLINVLRGEMSIVGPRPHAIAHDRYYSAEIADYAKRMTVRPGITGWAQVNGSRGPTPTIDHMRQRVMFDIRYIEQWSLSLDFMILVRTVLMEFTRQDAAC
jgi:exopolysaccharide biosynthesis polyprenyl glycosylphosphotransferase